MERDQSRPQRQRPPFQLEHFLALQPFPFDLAMVITGQATRTRQGSIQGQLSFTGLRGREKS